MSRSSSASTSCRIFSPMKLWPKREPCRQQVPGSRPAGRARFPRLPIVTIDGETARDFDDAVHVAALSERQLRVAGAYRGRGALCPSRLRRSTGKRVCVAPPCISESRRSHAAGRTFQRHLLAESAGGSAGDERDHGNGRDGNASRRFTPGVIRSAERMTYTNVYKVLEGDPEMSARYAQLVPTFPPHERTRTASESPALRTRLDRLRSARTDHRIRRSRDA